MVATTVARTFHEPTRATRMKLSLIGFFFTVSAASAAKSYLKDVNTTGLYATCPVLGVNITSLDEAPSLTFDNGQKLYFGSEEAVVAYQTNPKAYWLSPFEMPLEGMDGKMGLPNFSGETFYW